MPQTFNVLLRSKAAEALFAAFDALSIRATLTDGAALALYDPEHKSQKALTIVVDDPTRIATDIRRLLWNHDPSHFKGDKDSGAMYFQSEETPEISRNHSDLKILLLRDLIPQDMSENIPFPTCMSIGGIPVLPLSYILGRQLDTWHGRYEKPTKKGKITSKLVESALRIAFNNAEIFDWDSSVNLMYPRAQEHLDTFLSAHPSWKRCSISLEAKQPQLGLFTATPTFSLPASQKESTSTMRAAALPTPTRRVAPPFTPDAQSDRTTKFGVNVLLRSKAAEALFSAFDAMSISAALMGVSGLALYDPTVSANKQLVVVVDNPTLVAVDLNRLLVEYDRKHFKSETQRSCIYFQSKETRGIESNRSHFTFHLFRDLQTTQDGIAFPSCEIIKGIPVLPVANILGYQLDLWYAKYTNGHPGISEAAKNLEKAVQVALTNGQFRWDIPVHKVYPDVQEQLDTYAAAYPTRSDHLPTLKRLIDEQLQSLGTLAPPPHFQAMIQQPGPPEPKASPTSTIQPVVSSVADIVHDFQKVNLAASASDVPGPSSIPSVFSGTGDQILKNIARGLVTAIQKLPFDCALSGRMAGMLYGAQGKPERLGILVFGSFFDGAIAMGAEDIKYALEERNRPRLFFDPKPKPKHRKSAQASQQPQPRNMYWLVTKGQPLPNGFVEHKCPIDILRPGFALHYLQRSHINWIDGLPVLPFVVLLLLELRQWGMATEQAVVLAKTQDIKSLLDIAPNLPLKMVRPWSEKEALSAEFRESSEVHVKRFCQFSPETKEQWQGLGFELV